MRIYPDRIPFAIKQHFSDIRSTGIRPTRSSVRHPKQKMQKILRPHSANGQTFSEIRCNFLSKNDKNYLFCERSLLSLPHRRLKLVRTPPITYSANRKWTKNRKKISAAPSAGHLYLLLPGFSRRIHPQLRAPRVVEPGDRLAGCVRGYPDAGKTRYRAAHLFPGGPAAKRQGRRKPLPDRHRTRIDHYRGGIHEREPLRQNGRGQRSGNRQEIEQINYTLLLFIPALLAKLYSDPGRTDHQHPAQIGTG